MEKVVNPTFPKNNLFHQFYSMTTFEVVFSHPLGLTENVVKEAIITDVNDLVQEFWRTSTDEVNGEPIFAMRHLDEILRRCQRCLEVCFC